MANSIAYALTAAVLFSLAMHVQRRALHHLDSLTGTFVSVATMAALSWVLASWTLDQAHWRSEATVFFALAGLFFPALAQRLQISSNKHVGPALTAAFGAFLPLFATVPAVLYLGEALTWQQAGGIGLLIGALVVAALARGVDWRQRAFYLLFLPLFAALARALGMPLAKAGYNRLAEPIYGFAVMSTVSALVVLLMLVLTGTPRRALSIQAGHRLFAVNGLLIGVGFLLVQLSLVSGSVSVTTSIVATVPIWTLLMGALVFRNEELRWWHAGVAVAVCVGAVLIVTGAAAS